VENTVAKRHNNVSIEAALTAALRVGSLADSLGIIALVVYVIWSDPRPSLTLVLNTITSLEELKPAPAGRENVVPRSTGCPVEYAYALDRKKVLLVSTKLKVSKAPLLLNSRTTSGLKH
jgi:hypothetical protein